MRIALLAVAAALLLAGPAAAASPVRTASETQTQRIAIEIRQPRWSCFSGLVARRGPWGSLRRLEGSACPDLPWAILVREDAAAGWREVRRFPTRRAACRARPRGLEPGLRRALLGCHSADSSHHQLG